jgi:radical SAM superfamily enzyme YgiQ (UPF0313 family)
MMRLTFIHPAIGHRPGKSYMRTWQMESLPIAALAGLTPPDVEMSFFDDRMEAIDFDRPTDLVAIPVETYTAKRAYQIASEYRRRGVPVVMGGFHATLAPDEVGQYAEAVVTGEAEPIWAEVIDDARHGTLKRLYRAPAQPNLNGLRYDRSIFGERRYLSIGLVETGRGCRFPCEFCAVQTFFGQTHRRRPIEAIVAELRQLKASKQLFFFVDDNFAGDLKHAGALLDAIAAVDVRWVTQMSVDAAHDEDFVAKLARSGCRGVLIGFESLDRETLRRMGKKFNTMGGGYGPALRNLRRHGIRVYGTFVFGYETDTEQSFDNAVTFAIENRFYLAAFNHLTPFPGTPLYKRLAQEGRLLYDNWWLDERYSYNTLPFITNGLSPEDITQLCIQARRRFYGIRSMLARGFDDVNRADLFMLRAFFIINGMHRVEVAKRDSFPLGDPAWKGPLLKAA